MEIEPPKLLKYEELVKKAKDYTVISDTAMFNKLKDNNIETINYETGNYPLNEYLAKITFEKLSKTENDFNRAKVKPLYIQPPSIFGK